MKPSMKAGVYHVYLLLQSDEKGLASILSATCECAAGYVITKFIIYTVYVCIILPNLENLPAVHMCQQSFMLSLPSS